MKTALAAILFVSLAAPAASAADTVFDAPSDKQVRTFPETKDTGKTTLTCAYYPHFMVKQIDEGEIGAEQLSIVPIADGGKPSCQRANIPTAKVIDVGVWTGYFKGVKGGYVLFRADEGANGGLSFAVFNPNAEKLFEDAAVGELQSAVSDGSSLTLRYRRNFAGACSVVKEGAGCWNKIAAAAGLDAAAAKPDCAADYLKAKTAMATERCNDDHKKGPACMAAALKELDGQHYSDSPSVITYDVETVLGAGKPAVKVLSGALSCTPAD